MVFSIYFFFSSRRRHTRLVSDWSSDVCSSDLKTPRTPFARLGGGEGECLRSRPRAHRPRALRGRRPRPDRARRGARVARRRRAPPDPAPAGIFLARGARTHRGAGARDRGARRGAACDAGEGPAAQEDGGGSEAEERIEPARLRCGGSSRRARGPGRWPGLWREHADDAFRRRRRQGRGPVAARALRGGYRRRRSSEEPRQLRRAAALSGVAQGLGEAGHHALRLLAVPRRKRRSAGLETRDDTRERIDRGSELEPRRQRRIRAHLYGGRSDANRHGGLRLRRRLPAPRAHGHAGARGRQAHAHRGPRGDGYSLRRYHRDSASRGGLTRHSVGRRALCGRSRSERGHRELRAPVRARGARTRFGDALMAKARSVYSCTECGGESPKWQGQCPHCGAWNTLVEGLAESAPRHRFSGVTKSSELKRLADVSARDAPRMASGMDELDRVLGGGLGAGDAVLIGGDPGVGKSTLLLQVLARISGAHKAVYVSGEESAEQVALRARRLALDSGKLELLAEIQLERILATLEKAKPEIAVVDSIQTLYSEQLTSAPGSVAQVREGVAHLTRYAKASGTVVVLVGHVTKEGAIAGPRVVEHIVDAVLYFEGDTHQSFRLIRAFNNRFPAVNEPGAFAMTDRGLRGVSNPSATFLSQHAGEVAGSCVLVPQEGTRRLMVEIKPLVDAAHAPTPRRLRVGLEKNGLAMLLAVLHRHAGIACYDQDVFVNAVGGVRISEPAADLAVLLAIVSSHVDKPLPEKLAVFGEIGLAGEVRPAPRGQERLKEAAKLGFTRAIIPRANAPKGDLRAFEGLTIHAVERIEEAIEIVR